MLCKLCRRLSNNSDSLQLTLISFNNNSNSNSNLSLLRQTLTHNISSIRQRAQFSHSRRTTRCPSSIPNSLIPMIRNSSQSIISLSSNCPSPYNMPIATSLGDVASQGKQVPPSGPNLYRMAAVQQSGTAMSAAVPPLIHMAPEQGHPYTGMGYHVVHHHHPSQAPPASATAVAATYGYEYATDPSGKTPLFYTQVTSPGMAAPQYQAVANSTDMAVTGFPSGDGKPTRGA
ncbi:hypothetical protein HPP92_011836 [Vanilla planifolia]|uniref:Uncharacterized protein n=1 Tax=Vanilla planifolia TaxID=51239 RepID=A0A835R6U6_VANPL|nr:hypothetical protein HPP92_011836 [Vanilla planifolia]